MRIMMLTAGTRGDVEPFVVLAGSAAARGHEVRLGIPENSGVETGGLDVVSLKMDFAQLIGDQGVSPWAAASKFRTVIRPAVGRLLSSAVEHIVIFAPDMVVYHPKVLSAPLAAAALGIPSVLVESIPSLTPTREFPAPAMVSANLGPFNRATYRTAALAVRLFRREMDQALKILPAAPARLTAMRTSIMPISPQLLARPRDWPATVHLTGSWNRQVAAPGEDPELEDFMDSGDFIYAGFGSMKAGDARQRGQAVIDAARRSGLNVLVTTGWGGLEVPRAVGDGVLVRESVAHEHVLPRAKTAIHHGGAGTVHAVARAGIPSIVVPFIGDQPFWGKLLHRHGLAPEPIPFRKLNAARLMDALDQTETCRDHARQTGERIRSEDGVAVAVDVLENLAG